MFDFITKKREKILFQMIENCIDSADPGMFTCKSVLLDRIGDLIAANLDALKRLPENTNIEETSFRILSDMTFRLLSTGEFHVYSGSLDLIGQSMLVVFKYSQNWAYQHGFMTKAEFDESIEAILINIKNL
jgi:hypothetical protein